MEEDRRELADVPELRSVGDAVARGSRRSSVRLVAGVCPDCNQTVVEVFRGSDSELYAVYRFGLSKGAVPARVATMLLRGSDQDIAPRCRCKDVRIVWHSELIQALDLGKKRVVLTGPATTIDY